MILNLIPGDWHKYSLTGEFLEPVVDRREAMAFRFFTDRGPIDVPFAVHMLGFNVKTTLRNERLALSRLKAADLTQ